MNPPSLDEGVLWIPVTEQENDFVRRQLERLLGTNHFKHSQRYPALFRYIIEETLAGRGEYLKERLLGIHVFDRPPDYDTASDPIVRVTMAEIRRRVLQYYEHDAEESELRILLTPGKYVPAFRKCRAAPAAIAEQADEGAPSPKSSSGASVSTPVLPVPPVLVASPTIKTSSSRSTVWMRVAAATVLLIVLCAVSRVCWLRLHPTAIEEFWGPVVAAHRTILLCLPSGSVVPGYNIPAESGIVSADGLLPVTNGIHTVTPPGYRDSTFLDHEIRGENIVFSDAQAVMKISDWMARHGRESRLRLNVATTLDDVRQGPTVLIGGLNNEWTLRALAPLRYRFHGNYHDQFWIADAKQPAKRDWQVDLKADYGSVTRDFALIARIHDEDTGQVEVLASGIGMSGTAAAGAFLVDPDQLEELRRRVGRGFGDRDFEVVLRTDVVNGIAGAAKIVAVDVR